MKIELVQKLPCKLDDKINQEFCFNHWTAISFIAYFVHHAFLILFVFWLPQISLTISYSSVLCQVLKWHNPTFKKNIVYVISMSHTSLLGVWCTYSLLWTMVLNCCRLPYPSLIHFSCGIIFSFKPISCSVIHSIQALSRKRLMI